MGFQDARHRLHQGVCANLPRAANRVRAALRRRAGVRSALGLLLPIRPRAGRAPPTYSSGLGSPPPHLHRDWAHPSHVFPGTGLAAAHICAGTGPHSQARQLAGTCPYVRTARYGTASHTPTLTTAAAAARADRKSVDFVQGLDDAETPVSVRSTKVRTDSGRTPATRIPSLGAGTL